MKSLKIIFFGSPYYSVPLLDKTLELGHDVSLVVSQGTTKTRRGKIIKTSVHQCCEEKNIKCILPDRFSDSVTKKIMSCLLYTSPSPRDSRKSRMPSSA